MDSHLVRSYDQRHVWLSWVVPMCVPIQWVHRDSSGVVTNVGGSTDDGRAWGLTVQEAADLQDASSYDWYVEVPAGHRVDVWVKRTAAGRKFLTTSPDGIQPNNLDSLPNLPMPLAGVEPPYPLSIPGDLTVTLMSIDTISYSGNHTLTQLPGPPLTPPIRDRAGEPTPTFDQPASFWQPQTPRWFYLSATLPFPADYQVSLDAISGPGQMEWVGSNDIGRRHTLEAAGGGWWTYEFVLTRPDGTIDPDLPARLTPVKLVINPGTRAWARQHFNLLLTCRSVNPNCHSGGTSGFVSFTVRKPAAPPPPSPPPTVVVPNVVGLRLDAASRILWGLGMHVTNVGPVAVASDLRVDSQSPVGGTTVNAPGSVLLSTSVAVAAPGIKSLVITNQSNRAQPLDIWLYDAASGQWKKDSTIAYQAQGSVELDDGHLYLLAAVDSTLNNCHSGTPDEISCVYSAPQRTFYGDGNGIDLPWTIT